MGWELVCYLRSSGQGWLLQKAETWMWFKKSVPIWGKNIPEEGITWANTLRVLACTQQSKAIVAGTPWMTVECGVSQEPDQVGPGRPKPALRLYLHMWWEDFMPRVVNGRTDLHFQDHSGCPVENRLEGTKGSQRDRLVALALVNSSLLNIPG